MIFNVKIVENLNTRDLIEHIKNELLARGWTIPIFVKRTSGWVDQGGGYYDYVPSSTPSDDGQMAVESIGYGNQLLHFRIGATQDNEHTGGSYDRIWLRGYAGSAAAINHYSSIHPVGQMNWWNWTVSSYWKAHVHSVARTLLRAWIFTTAQCCIVVMQNSSSHVTIMHFGTIEVAETEQAELAWASFTDYYGLGYDHTWDQASPTRYHLPPFCYNVHTFYWDGREAPSSNLLPNMGMNTNLSEWMNWAGINVYNFISHKNAYSDLRPLFRQVVYGKLQSDGKWRVLGFMPYYMINVQDLALGQMLIYGSKVYYVFPPHWYGFAPGIAIRVA